MSKQVLTLGFLNHNYTSHGLISCSVDRNPTKIDVSDSGNNNDLLIGRKIWTFSATIISDHLRPIVPDSVEVPITIAMGDHFYVGTGFVLAVSHSGAIDDKIVYNVHGEFVPDSYFGISEVNGLYWIDEDNDGEADEWTISDGTGTISTHSLYGRRQRIDAFTNETFSHSMSGTTGEDIIGAIQYESNNLSTASFSSTTNSISIAVTLDTAGAVVRGIDASAVRAAGDTLATLAMQQSSSGNYIHVYFALVGKLIDSLT